MSNLVDLRSIKADEMRPREVLSLFTPSEKFENITDGNSIFLIGPKGSGKTMILHYLSCNVQLERFKNKKLIEFDKRYFGLYIRCNRHFFGSESGKINELGEIDEEWKKRFIHLFNITVVERIFFYLLKMRNEKFLKMSDNEEQIVCDEINGLFSITSKKNFLELRKTFRDEINKIAKNQEVFFTAKSCLAQLHDILHENIKNFEERDLVILLDEYQELDSIQQEVISEIISVRNPIFKIATLPSGFTTERTTKNKNLELSQDFQTIELGSRNITIDGIANGAIKQFFIKMINKRLEKYKLDIIDILGNPKKNELEIDSSRGKPVYWGLDTFIFLSSGNAMIFLDLVKNAMRSWDFEHNKEISPQNQDQVVRYFARKKIEEIEYIPGTSGYILRALILKIGLLFRNYFKQTKRSYLHIGIIDPENISEEIKTHLEKAFRRSHFLLPDKDRYSREGIKLLSITLHNSLLPYFDLPIQTHQVKEVTAKDIGKLIQKDSQILGTKIQSSKDVVTKNVNSQSLDVYLQHLDNIIEYLKNNDLVLFVGSGFSAEAGLPTGTELAKKITKKFQLGEDFGADLSFVCNQVISSNRGFRGELVKFIKEVFEKSQTKQQDIFKKLTELGIKTIYTTNWDSLIENAFNKEGVNIEKIVRDDSISLSSDSDSLLYKLHGDFEHADLIVLTEDDEHLVIEKKKLMMTRLLNDLSKNHFLFIGYSMADWDFNSLMKIIKESQGVFKLSSYATMPNLSKNEEKELENKNIIPLKMSAGEIISSIHQKINDST